MSKIDYNGMIIRDFINHIIKFQDVKSILDTCVNQSEKGFIFERLWDIVIKFGFSEVFQRSNVTHMIGNMNLNYNVLRAILLRYR